DELYDLTARFPDINTLRLTQLTCDQRNVTGKEKHVGKMTMIGMYTIPKPVDELLRKLNIDGHYMVGAKTTRGNSGSDRFRFRTQFTTQVDLEKLPPNDFELRLPEVSEDKPERALPGGNRRPGRVVPNRNGRPGGDQP